MTTHCDVIDEKNVLLILLLSMKGSIYYLSVIDGIKKIFHSYVKCVIIKTIIQLYYLLILYVPH